MAARMMVTNVVRSLGGALPRSGCPVSARMPCAGRRACSIPRAAVDAPATRLGKLHRCHDMPRSFSASAETDLSNNSSWASPVLLFPGQGTQYVGMCQDLAQEFAAARHVLEEVDEALQERLSHIMVEGDNVGNSARLWRACLPPCWRADANLAILARVPRTAARRLC